MRSLNHIPKVLIPCSKGGLQCAAEAQCDLQSSVTEPTAALPFQDKGVRDDFDPNLLLANIKSEEGMPQNPPEGVSGTVTRGLSSLVPFPISMRF